MLSEKEREFCEKLLRLKVLESELTYLRRYIRSHEPYSLGGELRHPESIEMERLLRKRERELRALREELSEKRISKRKRLYINNMRMRIRRKVVRALKDLVLIAKTLDSRDINMIMSACEAEGLSGETLRTAIETLLGSDIIGWTSYDDIAENEHEAELVRLAKEWYFTQH